MGKEKNRAKGIIGTIVFHVAILLALIFFGLSTPLPLPGEEGVEVNLGSSDQGMGFVQEEEPAERIKETRPPPPPPEEEEIIEEEIITQEVEEAPVIEEEKTEKREEKEEVIEEPPIEDAARPDGKRNAR